MEDYQKENKQYSDYEERCNLMDGAIKDMKTTMGYLNKHQGNLEAVNEYVEYSKTAKQFAEVSSGKQIEPIDYLNKRIHEEEANREKNVEKYLGADKEARKTAGKELVKSCFNALYMEVIKEEYSPKPGETPEQKAKRNEELSKAIDRGEKGKVSDMKKIIDSEFGKKYISNCMKMMVAGKKFTQEKLIECRDTAMVQCYEEYRESFRSAKTRQNINELKTTRDDLINLSRMAKALGSEALNGKKLPAPREDSKVDEYNLKSENRQEHKKSI